MKKTLLVGFLITVLFFSGCEYADFGAEGLLQAPKLNEEQSLIHQALIGSVGSNTKLKYPRSGENRSSYVLANIDDEPTEEAIVFYQRTGSSQSSVRINVLDQLDGKWVSVYDLGGVSTEVDMVMISRLGENEPVSIVVGFGSSSSIEKSFFIYSYDGGVMTEAFSDVYNRMDIVDFDNDGISELVTVTNSSETSLAYARMFRSVDGVVTCVSGMEMDGSTLSFSSFVKGGVFKDTKAIFLDGSLGNGTMKTEILIFRNGGLQNLMYSKYNKMSEKTIRPIGYSCVDVDSDGIVEIPVTTAFTGYEEYPADEQMLSTDWYTYEGYFSLKKKYTGYYNINDAYVFMLPSRWQGLVTVKRDTVTDEIVFYRYDGEINDNMTELMRIRVSSRQETNDLIYKGYSLITSKGQLDYLVKSGESSRQPLVLTAAEITNNFYVL